jgi:2-hydroxy-6-oxonona-2,4-dienedioate hydrolase
MDRLAIDQYRAAEQRLWEQYDPTPTEHVVRLPTYHTRIRVIEVAQGEPVLFVHGSPNAAPKWAPLAAHLPDFRCLLLDRPGCGLSEPIDYADVDLRAFGADLLSLTLTGLNVPTAAVVASSLGGALAFYFTRFHPARVVRLVQEGCPAFVHCFRLPLYTLVWSVLGLLGGPAPRSETAFRRMGYATSIDRGGFHTNVFVWRDALLRYTATYGRGCGGTATGRRC